MAKPFTVIGYEEKTGRICCDHVEANNPFQAFFVSAQKNASLSFISAHRGTLQESFEFDCPGEGVVDAETILQQEDVFNMPEPESEVSKDSTRISHDLLSALQHTLNMLPRKRIGVHGFKDTYELASALDQAAKG